MRTTIALITTLGLVLVFGVSLNPKPQTSVAQTEGVYVVAYRAPNHIQASSPQVFHGFADDLIGYLKSRDVNILEDPERGILQTDQFISVDSLLNLTKNAGANYLLLTTVERPMARWMKVTVQAYDLTGKLLWSEEANSGQALTGKGAPEKTLKSLKKKLDPRIDKPGLPRKLPQTPAIPRKEEAPRQSAVNR